MFAKTKKAVLVVFITCLIWVWADLSLDDVLENQTVTIIASKANESLWVTIEGKSEIQLKANISGPVGKIREIAQKIDSGKEKLEVSFDPEKQNMAVAGDYKIQDVRKFLAESDKIRDYGLGVKFVRPDTLNIKVVELKNQTLSIKCVDETDTEIPGAKMTPDIITTLAPELTDSAKIKLSSLMEKKQARGGAIEKKPYIELANGEIRNIDKTVKVELPTTSEDMKPQTISGTLGFIFSANLAGGYKVEFTKKPEIGSIPIIATDEAKAAYEEKAFEVLLEIQDDDVSKPEITRQIIYNFPAKYVSEDKIRLKGNPVEAKFKLVPVSTVTAQPIAAPALPPAAE
ncbi:MAG: hypothetical protein WC765_08870 [Phycisphaerae bacterium]|jgi:hypothetical protein